MMSNNIFVFVVCGSKEHIETLHYSLRYLKHFSSHQIWVITDSSRNEIKISHDTIIEIETPKEYNHHQASIYLKTGLHKFLPKDNNYCYLDTDVIALSNKCDEIFNELISPIRFAADHCLTYHFSPHAINCGCFEKMNASTKLLLAFLNKYREKQVHDEILLKQSILLQHDLNKIQESFFLSKYFALKFILPFKKIWINDKFYFDKIDQVWKIKSGEIVMYDINIKEIEEKTGYRFIREEDRWVDKMGVDVWDIGCNHLVERIKQTFGIDVTNKRWQHWNGGVFLFNNKSHDFLEAWHKKTLKIFKLPDWKTRDQGTLIATVWEYKLQNHPVMEKQWNFLADDNNPQLGFDEQGYFTGNNWRNKHKVNFAHIYHRFGDKSWNLWNYINNLLPDEN